MRIAFLVSRMDHASVYYRVVQYLPFFADKGVASAIIPLPKRYHDRILLYRSLAEFQGVVLVRKLLNRMNLPLLRRYASFLVFDLDDALFMHDSKARRAASLTRRGRLKRIAHSVDHVICGNRWILEHVSRLTSRCTVIPTVVAPGRYGAAPGLTRGADGFRVVWIGSRSTLFYLEELLPALAPLKALIPGLRLRVISDRFPETTALPVERIAWSREEEVPALRESHVGLMPLRDDDWSRGKCGLKLLQYGAAGLPSVCTPVGVNAEIVDHGRTGFHARTPGEWRDAILHLYRNEKERIRMGAAARTRVERRWSVAAVAPRYLEILRNVLQGAGVQEQKGRDAP